MRNLSLTVTALLLAASVHAAPVAPEGRRLTPVSPDASPAEIIRGEPANKSAARKQELSKIKRLEEQAAAAQKQELTDIRRKQGEIEEIDRQVGAMKARMAAGTPRANDKAETIAIMLTYKAEHINNLQSLREKHSSAEPQRVQQLSNLKRAAEEKWLAEIQGDVADYQKVAMNKYTKSLREAAWDTLAAAWPEAREVKRHDPASLLTRLGVPHSLSAEQSCFEDPLTGLMWVKTGFLAGKTMNWQEALSWSSALYYGGFDNWRLPTKEELTAFVKKWERRPAEYFKLFGISNVQEGGYWSATSGDNDTAWSVNSSDGSLNSSGKNFSLHVWPVRAKQWQ